MMDDLLQKALDAAYVQSSKDKGLERHVVKDEAFENQLICSLERRGHTFNTGQASKKIDESLRLPPDKAIHELLGAMVYCAARIIILEEEIERE